MPFHKKIDSIIAGAYHAILKTIDNEYFSFGCNQCGELGLGPPTENKFAPQRIPND
jgi:alpha-tubulin suppressor-like RCC1 family protein